MSDPLRTCRVYCFDGDQMTVSGEMIQASSDEEAIAKAEAMGVGSKCEVWEDNRLVARFEGEWQSNPDPGDWDMSGSAPA